MIRRSFADLPTRQVHYRHDGEGPPLLMLHASPGSSKQLESKIKALSASRKVIAPDTPGNGDSTPLPLAAPAIPDYAAALLDFLDEMRIEQCDVYGSHTGAHIAMEFSILAPNRVRRVVLDGIGLYTAEERARYLANYAIPMEPNLRGTHLTDAFLFCRDQYLFWPWFETAPKNSRRGGLPTAEVLHDWVLEVCKSLTTYHLGYRAAFSDRAEERLPLMTRKALLLAGADDPLIETTRRAAELAPGARLQTLPASDAEAFDGLLADTINAFLNEPD